jgi:MFS transporter, CP family, cyanate transporter
MREPVPASRQISWTIILALWLAGVGLRLTILALPPVIADIRNDFALNATQVGLLSSIAPALFAIAALAGSLLVARLGIKQAMTGGLILVAAGSALRGISTGYLLLCLTTILMSIGVAIMQPIMPTAVRQWLPGRIGLGTAVYTNGLLAGEIFPVLLTIPLVLPMVDGSWRWSLVAWSLPVTAIILVIWFAVPHTPVPHAAPSLAPKKWLPDWHLGLVWRLGMLFCCINAIYFSANAFIPIYLTSKGRPDLIGATLTALNFCQLPSSLLLLAFAGRLERKAWLYIVSGMLSLICIIGLITMTGPATVVWAGLLGFSDASALILGLTLPALLCKPEDTARTTAGVFTLSYGGAVALALVSGALWDLTGIPALAFLPIGLCAAGLSAMALQLRLKHELV